MSQINYSYERLLNSPLNSISSALDTTSNPYNIVVGAVNPDRIRYPAAHIIPQNLTYNGNREFEAIYDLYFYYEKEMNRVEAFTDMITETTDTLNSIFEELQTNEEITNTQVTEINFYPREYENTLLDVMNFRIRAIELRQ